MQCECWKARCQKCQNCLPKSWDYNQWSCVPAHGQQTAMLICMFSMCLRKSNKCHNAWGTWNMILHVFVRFMAFLWMENKDRKKQGSESHRVDFNPGPLRRGPSHCIWGACSCNWDVEYFNISRSSTVCQTGKESNSSLWSCTWAWALCSNLLATELDSTVHVYVSTYVK